MTNSGPLYPIPTYDPGIRGIFQVTLKRWRSWLQNRGQTWIEFFRNPVARIAFVIIIFFGLLAVLQPLLMNTILSDNIYDPLMGFDPAITHPSLPSLRHILGTDYLGRDVFSQLILATRTSFAVGLLSAVIASVIAVIIGVSAAYFGGLVDTILMMFTDVFIMLPPFVVLFIVGLVIELTWYQVALIYGVFAGLGSFALMLKVQTLTIKKKNYTLAAELAGGNPWRIIRVHILPNLAALIGINMMFIVTGSVMIEALLSYFERSFRFSWGTMIWYTIDNFRGAAEGLQWHVLLAPVIAIILFCGAFYMLARTLDEVVTPTLKER